MTEESHSAQSVNWKLHTLHPVEPRGELIRRVYLQLKQNIEADQTGDTCFQISGESFV